ncbi:MAG: M1 family metallopeptidase [Planctomycetes bacterium]|nr:M1 family metallopeptidase [Planctomycetota bacterium]
MVRRRFGEALLLVSALFGCAFEESVPLRADAAARGGEERPMAHDIHSFARPEEARVRRLELDLTVDFATKRLSGRASLLVAAQAGAKQLLLDTRDLEIRGVRGDAPLAHALGPVQGDFGQALTIELPAAPAGAAARELWIHVDYATSPAAAAVQWLAPAQTAGGKSPFLFTQSQAILARTWVPCQDSPGVRMTYGARIKVNSPAGGPPLLAVMSAAGNPERASPDGTYTFDMPQPIPSYLLALAVGDLAFRSLGPRSGVYAEPSVVARAADEFVDLESMIAAAEQLYGPYRWGRYDVLVLPPSFPFGGMENPRLTFATPTILAGDRSLVSLVAHELAHSWSGNLVTNATWNDFWLNEGFTVYFEHRIMEAVYGDEFDEALAVLGLADLEHTIAELTAGGQARDTWLRLDLAGRNPDDGVTEVAYQKGARFLQAIEQAVGRAKFDRFLRAWFDGNAFESRTTDDFLAFLRRELLAGQPALEASLRIGEWVDGPGLPTNCPRATSRALEKAAAEMARFKGGAAAAALDVKGFTTQQWQQFLRALPAGTSGARLAELDAAFGLSNRGNSEVLFQWLERCVALRHEAALPALERFLTAQGRRKFLKPLYQELAKSSWGKPIAMRIYAKARPGYHAVSTATIDGILKWGK